MKQRPRKSRSASPELSSGFGTRSTVVRDASADLFTKQKAEECIREAVVSKRRDRPSRRFFTNPIRDHSRSCEVVTDRATALAKAIGELAADPLRAAQSSTPTIVSKPATGV